MQGRDGGARGDSGIVAGPTRANQGTSLAELGLRCFQALVGNVNPFFQCIQLRVIEQLPPFAPKSLIFWLGRLPAAGRCARGHCLFFIIRRRRHNRPRVLRANRATAQENNRGDQTRPGPAVSRRRNSVHTVRSIHPATSGFIAYL